MEDVVHRETNPPLASVLPDRPIHSTAFLNSPIANAQNIDLEMALMMRPILRGMELQGADQSHIAGVVVVALAPAEVRRHFIADSEEVPIVAVEGKQEPMGKIRAVSRAQ